ncbi:SUKH-3 domain-containing protein [Kitasatospora sp. NPDC051914]|uniref:SUKH-3 domain-containing protein n=1 Tax=Kitasatospora sp. NPDC051914 TaxID=3154945 RepID=UPI003446D94A
MPRAVSDSWLGSVLSPGWSPIRRVDVSEALAAWKADGHYPLEPAIEVASRLDGLSFRYPRPAVGESPDECSFDAAAASRSIYPQVVRGYENAIGSQLCPVGVTASRHVVLMVSGDGAIYGGYDRFLARYGGDWREAIWVIYNRISPSRITLD